MTTYLTKPVKRSVLIGQDGQVPEVWITALLPSDSVYRFPRIEFRLKGTRKVRYWIPLEAVRNDAARRWALEREKEKKKLRKERQLLKREGLL